MLYNYNTLILILKIIIIIFINKKIENSLNIFKFQIFIIIQILNFFIKFKKI